jgi:hypothetical protein
MSQSSTAPTPPRDPDLANAIHALRRSARRALEIALQTGTPCYIWQDGRIVNIGAPERVEPPPAS